MYFVFHIAQRHIKLLNENPGLFKHTGVFGIYIYRGMVS